MNTHILTPTHAHVAGSASQPIRDFSTGVHGSRMLSVSFRSSVTSQLSVIGWASSLVRRGVSPYVRSRMTIATGEGIRTEAPRVGEEEADEERRKKKKKNWEPMGGWAATHRSG